MAELLKTRTSQAVHEAHFTFNFDDTMVNEAGAEVDFGAADIASATFAVIKLPMNAVVVGGEWTTETVFDTAGYDVTVGDSGSGTRYLGSTDVKGAARTALTLTGYRHTTATDILITRVSDDVCTTGKATLRLLFVIDGRAEEVTGT